MNLKLRTLLLIAILLISGNACLAQTHTPPPSVKRAILPLRYKCLDLLELEKIQVNQQTNTMTYNDAQSQLAADYNSVAGWFQGFFTAVNTIEPDGGDITKGTTIHQWITWAFSYCRAHPSDTLTEVAVELLNSFRRDTRK